MSIKLKREVEQQLIASIKRFFSEKLDDEIGDLKATLLLDYVVCEIGPSIYNQAVSEAQAFLQDKVSDLDGSCYQPEFTYWQK